MPHRPGHSRYGGSTPGPVGMGSAPKSFVDRQTKSKTQSVSTSDVATGKFTGGTQKSTPKPKVDKTFEDINTTPSEQLTGRDAAIKTYSTTGLKNLGEKRKKDVIRIINNPNTTQNQKNKIIKNKNLSGALDSLRKRTQTAPAGLGIPTGGRDITFRKKPIEKNKPKGFFDWGGKGLTFFSPQHQQMDKDARIEINKAFALPPSLGFRQEDWAINKGAKVDAMRHLMWSAINPALAVAHDITGGDTQDLHNNALRSEVLSRASKMEGGTT